MPTQRFHVRKCHTLAALWADDEVLAEAEIDGFELEALMDARPAERDSRVRVVAAERASRSGNERIVRVTLLRSAVLACGLTSLVVITGFGGTASARPKSWKPCCAQLNVIKKTSETPGGWTSDPDDRFGEKKFAHYYSNLKRLAPANSMVTLLKSAHPILAHGADCDGALPTLGI